VQNRLSGERDIKKNKAIHHFLKPEKPVTAERQHANPRAFWTRKQKKKGAQQLLYLNQVILNLFNIYLHVIDLILNN